MSDKPKICKECRFCIPPHDTVKGHYCSYGEEKVVDLVTGQESYMGPTSCYFMRAEFGRCKPEGLLWEGIL